MITLLLSLAAHAAEPSTWVTDRGAVIGTATVAAPPATVLPLLLDAPRLVRLDGGGTQVTVVGPDGPCTLLDYTSPSILSEIRYRVRQCPTSDGLESSLVESPSFSAYHARWTVTPQGTGALLKYEISMTVRMMVPDSLVHQASRRAVKHMLGRVVGHFGSM